MIFDPEGMCRKAVVRSQRMGGSVETVIGSSLASCCVYCVGSSVNFCTRQFSNSAAYRMFSEGQASS